MRRAAHRDAAEPDIIKAHRAAGDSVAQISSKDVSDLLIGSKGVNYIREVKSRIVEHRKGRRNPRIREGRLSKGQEDFKANWKGGPVVVVYTPEESLASVGHTPEEIARALRIAGLATQPSYTPPRPTCPACVIDPQQPCRHDGEARGVAVGTIPPRRRNLRAVDRAVSKSEAPE